MRAQEIVGVEDPLDLVVALVRRWREPQPTGRTDAELAEGLALGVIGGSGGLDDIWLEYQRKA